MTYYIMCAYKDRTQHPNDKWAPIYYHYNINKAYTQAQHTSNACSWGAFIVVDNKNNLPPLPA